MKMLQISQDALLVLVKNDFDKDQLITRLIQYCPDVFLKMLHDDDLIFQIQMAYSQPRSPGSDFKGPNKVAAIKEYRRLTGTDLKDAKHAVEAMMETNQITSEFP